MCVVRGLLFGVVWRLPRSAAVRASRAAGLVGANAGVQESQMTRDRAGSGRWWTLG